MNFQFENQQEVAQILEKYPLRSSALIPLLDLAQQQCGGWIHREALEHVAHFVGVPLMQALEVATFYSMFHLQPVGKHHIKICRTLSCWLNGAEEIAQVCQETLNMTMGETKGEFTLSHVECVGYCDCAPVVQINKENYHSVTPQKMREMLQSFEEE